MALMIRCLSAGIAAGLITGCAGRTAPQNLVAADTEGVFYFSGRGGETNPIAGEVTPLVAIVGRLTVRDGRMSVEANGSACGTLSAYPPPNDPDQRAEFRCGGLTVSINRSNLRASRYHYAGVIRQSENVCHRTVPGQYGSTRCVEYRRETIEVPAIFSGFLQLRRG